MKTLSPDTSPETEAVWIAGLRRLSPAEKLEQVVALNALARAIQEAALRRAHPDASEREVRLRVAARRLGPEVVKRVFDWPPDSAFDG